MPVITAPYEYNDDELYVDLWPIVGQPILLKCEGLNFAGSIKLKAAVEMVEAAERSGALRPGSILIESSSGNLGVALAMIAVNKGYGFLCVTDHRCNLGTRRTIEAFGGQVQVVTEAHPVAGLLGARIAHVRELCAEDGRYVWLNQYENPSNWGAHFSRTGPSIARDFPGLDVLFVGAGTTGTLMGCARYFRQYHPSVRIVAVDAVGSVTFGGAPSTRVIPGLGSGVRPPMLDEVYIDDVVLVEEPDTVRECHRLARHGFLFGGSTGTVVNGAVRWMDRHGNSDMRTVAIAPDLGERYLDTIYQTNWVEAIYGPEVLRSVLDDAAIDSDSRLESA